MTSGSRISVVLPILTPTPFLRAMSAFAIKTLRAHADFPGFELIVVEADGRHFDPASQLDPEIKIDKYLNFNPKIGGVKELNAGIDAASHGLILSTGNDVIVPPGWDTELLSIFAARKDCGIACLAACEPGAVIGPREPHPNMPAFVEGWYSPFMMFRKGWRFDESFVKIYQDSDMVLKMAEQGLRAYRSCRRHVHHLLRMTSDRVEPEKHQRDLAHDERLFYERWGNSPLWTFGVIRSGIVAYGSEHEAWTRPIHLHYDPSKPA